VETEDVSLLIDPGAAVMHPSFPLSFDEKVTLVKKAEKAVSDAAKLVDVITISHYHYDHYLADQPSIYKDKLLLVKNPNQFINDSQRSRAEKFFGLLCQKLANVDLNDLLLEPNPENYGDPLKNLPLAMNKDFGDYTNRRNQLLEKGKKWFSNRAKRWEKYPKIPELNFNHLKTRFADGKSFTFGKTKIRFTSPLFHGIEFSRVGWVFMVIVEANKEKLLHSSDLNGPIIEDYANMIVEENPDILILDGPMTYMLGYTLNKINMSRAVENASWIVENVDARLVVYDHHLPREPRFRERTEKVWSTAKKHGKKVLTAAELLGLEPVVLRSGLIK